MVKKWVHRLIRSISIYRNSRSKSEKTDLINTISLIHQFSIKGYRTMTTCPFRSSLILKWALESRTESYLAYSQPLKISILLIRVSNLVCFSLMMSSIVVFVSWTTDFNCSKSILTVPKSEIRLTLHGSAICFSHFIKLRIAEPYTWLLTLASSSLTRFSSCSNFPVDLITAWTRFEILSKIAFFSINCRWVSSICWTFTSTWWRRSWSICAFRG